MASADPLTPIDATAIEVHTVYESYVAAGFKPQQALYLVACAMNGHPGIAPDLAPPDGT